jgi:hypothetical protein
MNHTEPANCQRQWNDQPAYLLGADKAPTQLHELSNLGMLH